MLHSRPTFSNGFFAKSILQKKMFEFKTYEEAHSAKEAISDAVLGRYCVVSVATSKESDKLYIVKIGMTSVMPDAIINLYDALKLSGLAETGSTASFLKSIYHTGVISIE